MPAPQPSLPQNGAASAARLIRNRQPASESEHDKRVAWGKRWGAIVSDLARERRKERS